MSVACVVQFQDQRTKYDMREKQKGIIELFFSAGLLVASEIFILQLSADHTCGDRFAEHLHQPPDQMYHDR